MSTATPVPPAEVRRGRPYRITAEDSSRMLAAGAPSGGRRVERRDGVLVAKMIKNPPHVIARRRLNAVLGILEIHHVPTGVGPDAPPPPRGSPTPAWPTCAGSTTSVASTSPSFPSATPASMRSATYPS